jgi:hypothetical protein
MAYNRRFIIASSLLFAGVLLQNNVKAQSIARSTISVLGSTYREGTLTVQQTVGQSSMTQSNYGNFGGIRQGFMQPVNSTNAIRTNHPIHIIAYPNPANDLISIEGELGYGDQIRLQDIYGRTIQTQFIQGELSAQFHLDSYAAGVYTLLVLRQQQIIKSIPVIIK